MDFSIRVIALILLCDLRRFASRHPHLSVVQIFKDQLRCASPTSPSAAQKKDYEPFLQLRQAPRRLFRRNLTLYSNSKLRSSEATNFLVAGAGLEPATFGL